MDAMMVQLKIHQRYPLRQQKEGHKPYDHVIFVLLFVDVLDDIDGFSNVVPSLHPWDESHLIMMDDFLMYF